MSRPNIEVAEIQIRRNLRPGFGDTMVTCRVFARASDENGPSLALDVEAWLPGPAKGLADDPEGWVLRFLREHLRLTD